MSQNFDLNTPEFLMLDIKSRFSASILFAIIYRRPNGHVFSDFVLRFNLHAPRYKNIIITGDLNCNLLETSFESSFLQNFISDHSLFLIPHGPTHHTNNSDTQLDIIITDSESKVGNYSQSPAPYIAGHDLIALKYILNSFRPSHKTLTYRSFKNCDPCILSNHIISSFRNTYLDPSENEIPSDIPIDNIAAFLQENIIGALDALAPLKTVRVSRPTAPWLTEELKAQIRSRDELYKRAKRTNNQDLMTQYRSLRKLTKASIKDAKNNYLLSAIAETQDQSKMWSILRKAGLIETSSQSSLQHFTPIELNTHYSKITTVHPLCTEDQFNDIILTPPPTGTPSFSFSFFNCEQVQLMLLSTLAKSRGISPDGIQLSYLKDILPAIVPPLTRLFNHSLSTGSYPSIWKSSYIIPLNKVSVPTSPADTRPIANLSHLAKSFDALVTRQITSYLEVNNLLNYQQSGFRRFHSTQSVLLRILDDVRQGIDQGLVTVLVLFDFSKAFDTLNHSLILSQLRSFGFDQLSLKWIFSYLSGRSHSIRDSNGEPVPFLPCTSGVPQGSSPGPIFFIIFINSLFSRLKYCKDTCNIFADDTQFHLTTPFSRLSLAVANLNSDIESLVAWARDTGLILNAKKTQAIILGSPQYIAKLKKLNVPPIIVDGVQVPYSSCVKNLGVHISSDLTWNRQVSQISTNVHYALNRLKYRGSSLPSPIKLMLVNSLIIPHFDYACLVFNDATEYLETKLQRLQNVALRFVYNLRRDASLATFRKKAHWLTTRERRNYFLGALTYQVLNSSQPFYLNQKFEAVDPAIRRSGRQLSSSFKLPICRTDLFARCFWVTAIKNWDSLPDHVKLSPSIHSFKSTLMNHLINPN